MMCRFDLRTVWVVLVLASFGSGASVFAPTPSAEDDEPVADLQNDQLGQESQLSTVTSQRFAPGRQLSPLQQTHILNDIQQHHMFKPRDVTPSNVTLVHSARIKAVTSRVIPQQSFLAPQTTATGQRAVDLLSSNSQVPPHIVYAEPSGDVQRHQRESQADGFLYLNNDRQHLYKQLENKTYFQQKSAQEQHPRSNFEKRQIIKVTSKLNPVQNDAIKSDPRTEQKQQFPVKPKQNQQNLQEQLQKQFQQQLLQRQELLRQLKLAISQSVDPSEVSDTETRGTDTMSRITDNIPLEKSNSIQIDSFFSPTPSTSKPWPPSFEELSKGLLPQGAKFEVIRHNGGGLEEVNKFPANLPQKNVTFVFLEEQSDGTFKVQGIKGNNNTGHAGGGGDVDSIIKKIQDGDLKLPPATRLDENAVRATSPHFQPTSNNALTDVLFTKSVTVPSPTGDNKRQNLRGSSGELPLQTSLNPVSYSQRFPPPTKSPSKQKASFLPTVQTWSGSSSDNSPIKSHDNFTAPHSHGLLPIDAGSQKDGDLLQRPYRKLPTQAYDTSNVSSQTTESSFNLPSGEPLSEVLRREGLFAMAKFLKDSGLDNLLNNKGPYTLFAPTDKAFRSLLVQLGGPEKAAEKFKDNPKLLSGLLLHHVIPGAFLIGSLVNEMTGVSLAGTQLRVNTYASQDGRWNDLKVVTINGARVLGDKQDIPLPQGIAHAIDRVMFPLPVGDLVLTLQSDRTRRFTKFLRAMKTAGLADRIASSTSVTLFAPTDQAFSFISAEDVERLMTDKEMARALVLRHMMPGALYSAGMRYFQERRSMLDGQPITVYKNDGQVKVNTASVVTYNTPATNGVVHAINGLI